jgi:hypothetical protein
VAEEQDSFVVVALLHGSDKKTVRLFCLFPHVALTLKVLIPLLEPSSRDKNHAYSLNSQSPFQITVLHSIHCHGVTQSAFRC